MQIWVKLSVWEISWPFHPLRMLPRSVDVQGLRAQAEVLRGRAWKTFGPLSVVLSRLRSWNRMFGKQRAKVIKTPVSDFWSPDIYNSFSISCHSFFYNIKSGLHHKIHPGAREMAFPRDPSLIPQWLTTTCNCSSRDLTHSSGIYHPLHKCGIHKHK